MVFMKEFRGLKKIMLAMAVSAVSIIGTEALGMELKASSLGSEQPSGTFSFTEKLKYDLEDFVEIRPGQSLFVKWKKAGPSKPTVILLNGLTYSTRQWNQFAYFLSLSGVGVIQYDMFGMGKTLDQNGPVQSVITWQSQVNDLKALIDALKIRKPVNLVGLSYGGGIAMGFAGLYPKLTKNVILLAPFTEPLETQDLMIKSQVAATRFWYPYNPYSDDELYDYFLKQNVYNTYPLAEPVVLESPFKLEATFRMVQGIRKLPTTDLIQVAPERSLHLVIAGMDEYIPRSVMERFWENVPDAMKASKMIILQSKHKIPEDVPKFSADWVSKIVRGQLKSTGAQENFEGDVRSETIRKL